MNNNINNYYVGCIISCRWWTYPISSTYMGMWKEPTRWSMPSRPRPGLWLPKRASGLLGGNFVSILAFIVSLSFNLSFSFCLSPFFMTSFLSFRSFLSSSFCHLLYFLFDFILYIAQVEYIPYKQSPPSPQPSLSSSPFLSSPATFLSLSSSPIGFHPSP